MKFVVTFKTPDAIEMAISEAVESDIENRELSGEEAELEEYRLKDKLRDLTDKYVQYGELISIEFDTDGETATVKER